MQVPFTKPYFTKDMSVKILYNIKKIINEKNLMIGKFSNSLEKKFSNFIGVKYAVSVNSATTALQMALRYANVRGKEVIVPSASFITNVSSVIFENAKPILVDCDFNTLSYNINELKSKVNKNTAAIVLVHLTGYIADNYKEIVKLAKENKILLIEDCSHAHGSKVDGKQAGSIGDLGVFSFYPTKVLTSGSGGIITTNNKKMHDLAKSLRVFGKNFSNNLVDKLGNDWFLDEFRSAIVLEQLSVIEDILEKRMKVAKFYIHNLPKSDLFTFLNLKKNTQSCWYNFPIFFKKIAHKTKFEEEFSKNNISTKSIYRPVFEEKIFRKYFHKQKFIGSKKMLNCSLCLPIYTSITKKELVYVVKIFKNILQTV